MNIRPIKSKVVIKENTSEVKSAGGLILEMANSVKSNQTATVLAVGPEVELVSVGDTILIDWNKAAIMSVDGEQVLIVDESNIICVLEKE